MQVISNKTFQAKQRKVYAHRVYTFLSSIRGVLVRPLRRHFFGNCCKEWNLWEDLTSIWLRQQNKRFGNGCFAQWTASGVLCAGKEEY